MSDKYDMSSDKGPLSALYGSPGSVGPAPPGALRPDRPGGPGPAPHPAAGPPPPPGPTPSGSPCSSVSGKDSSGGSSLGSLRELTYAGLTGVDMCADMQNRSVTSGYFRLGGRGGSRGSLGAHTPLDP